MPLPVLCCDKFRKDKELHKHVLNVEVILLCGSAICWAKVLNSMVRKGLDQKRDVNRGVAPDPATSRTSDYAFASW